MQGKYDYWFSYHQHTSISNGLGYWEVMTKFEDYIDYAIKHHIPAVTSSEHGNVIMWIKRKELAEEANLKYVHSTEAYVTMNLDDKNRGYHTVLIAKNYDGVKEINRLSSASFNRKDGHFYYRPRILFDDLKETVSHGNIYVTTACLAGALSQTYKSVEEASVCKQWIKLASDYKDNVFLEVQPHIDKEQKNYNEFLTQVASAHGLKLIAANDVHALNPEHDRLRKIIKKGKKNSYDDDDKFELWCKTREEMVDTFREQGVLTEQEINDALDLTVEIANQVEEFELDKSHKYPHLYKNPEKEFQNRIKQGLKNRGILSLPKEQRQKYLDRVKYEYSVYKSNGAIDYMLSHEDILNAAKEHGIKFGYGRGSVSGSLIAYLCGQTEMDSVKLGLNFERFMNPQRISLADIDEDLYRPDQQWIQKWMLTNPKWHAASIMIANTYGLKAAIKVIADGMDRYAGKPTYIQSIRNQIGDDGFIPEQLYEEHQQLIDDAKKVVGVIDSFGRHAAGIVIDTNAIDDSMGIQTISGWDYPVTQVAMKEIDHFSWVKYDLLGLDNVGLISKTAELAGIPYPTPDSNFIDFEDENVWKSMREDNIGVFQMEGERAGKLLKDMLSPETMEKIKSNEAGKNVKYMDLLSLVNAAQRPSGASYVDAVTHGVFKDNGHLALNEFLAPTLGELVYQEQLIQFLVQFTGRTPGEADVLRRAVGKKQKDVIDREVPIIRQDFIKTMIEKYHDAPEHAESIANDFMQVFMDAANYGFSINHSMAYSYIGYISTWLRYYYPLEWCTAAFQIWEGKQEKLNRVVKFAKSKGISLKPFKFGKSKSNYYMDKQNRSIYEGTASIKGVSTKVGDELYLISDKPNKKFTDLLMDIYDNSQVVIKNILYSPKALYNKFSESELKEIDLIVKNESDKVKVQETQGFAITSKDMINLILLNYFSEFGSPRKLKLVYEKFHKTYKPKNKRFVGKSRKYHECLEYEESLGDEDYPLITTLQNEYRLLGRCLTTNSEIPANYAFITSLVIRSNKVIVGLYSIKHGREVKGFISKKSFKLNSISEGDLITVERTSMRPKNILKDGHWQKSKTDKELWIDSLVRKG
ncbi:PHP domain-containing protein [Limosilactobacillus reuteri]|uniref:PHP domain-containing protein n=1 Tax=Limosilactobacillus reuteri TaxID=1598 RepID=UPI002A7E1A9C|nr:PHP domain-containing protein [Limosilactobacillus reuteri]MDY5593788.1 PHP domain-containing protein [Limosilactobacillus reuteri]